MSSSASADLALIDSWTNEAIVQFLKDTKINVKTTTIAVTAGTGDYELDDDILSLEDLWMESANSTQDMLLKRVSGADIHQMRLYEAAEDITSMYYALEGAHLLMLYPAPTSSSDIINIKYVPRPTSAMSVTADTPSATAYGGIPAEYHPVLEDYVKWKACEAEEHKPSKYGGVFAEAYMGGVQMVKLSLNRKGGVMGAPVRWGRRQNRIPVSPGIDLGR